jgi:hypothetical protein
VKRENKEMGKKLIGCMSYSLYVTTSCWLELYVRAIYTEQDELGPP